MPFINEEKSFLKNKLTTKLFLKNVVLKSLNKLLTLNKYIIFKNFFDLQK